MQSCLFGFNVFQSDNPSTPQGCWEQQVMLEIIKSLILYI